MLERLSRVEAGRTLTSAPVSTRKRRIDLRSRTVKALLIEGPATEALTGDRLARFPADEQRGANMVGNNS